MKAVLIIVLVVAVVILAAGVVNHGQTVDFDYLLGTWQDVSLAWWALIVAGLVVVIGLVVAALVAGAARDDRRKLEEELQQTYIRLRAAEGAAPDHAAVGSTGTGPAESVTAGADEGSAAVSVVAPSGALEVPSSDAAVAAPDPSGAVTHDDGPDAERA